MRVAWARGAAAALACTGACGGGDPSGPDLTPGSIDLTVDQGALASTLQVVDRYFPPGHCAVVEGFVPESGTRRLLRFETSVVNRGELPLVVGDPAAPEPPFAASDFAWSPCHGHFHFEGWAVYELRDADGIVVGSGHKQAFCLRDSRNESVTLPSAGYDCDFQGISPGWADVYSRTTDGQWVDVTGVPAGFYTLVVTVNPDGPVVEEVDLQPDVASVTVWLDGPGGNK